MRASTRQQRAMIEFKEMIMCVYIYIYIYINIYEIDICSFGMLYDMYVCDDPVDIEFLLG